MRVNDAVRKSLVDLTDDERNAFRPARNREIAGGGQLQKRTEEFFRVRWRRNFAFGRRSNLDA